MNDERAAGAPLPLDHPSLHLIRLSNPSPEELSQVQHQLGLHPLIVSDLLEGRQHPKFERLGDHLYLTVWDILPRSDDPADTDGDIAMVFNALELLVVQRGSVARIRDIPALLQSPGRIAADSPISAVHRILDAVLHDFVDLGAEVEEELAKVEAEVFDSRIREDYRRIYRLRQRIGQIDRAADGLSDALRMGRPEIEALTADEGVLHPYFTHLELGADGVARLAAAQHAALDAVISSHESNVATRQNQDMRTISAFAALLAIPTVIAGIYGMNFKHLPLIQWELGWVPVGLAMLTIDLIAVLAFRRRGWLGVESTSREDEGNS